MTLEELRAETPPGVSPPCEDCVRDLAGAIGDVVLGNNVFLAYSEKHQAMVYMTISEDGRQVPLEDW